MPIRWLALAAGALALAGCDLGPGFVRPEEARDARFREADPAQPAAWPDPSWWQGFGSPELDGLIATARAQNPDMAAAAARVRQADAQMRIAGAALLPDAAGGASAQWQQTSVLRRGRHIQPEGRQYAASLNIGWEVDFWGKNQAREDAARATALASRFDERAIAISVDAAVAQAWFGAEGAQDRLDVARRNLAESEATLRVVRGRFEAGTASALDVAQQEALAAGQRALIPLRRNDVEQSLIALGILTGRPPADITERPRGLGRLRRPEVAPGLPSELLARRPDVAAAEADLVAANADIRAARAAFYPSIRLTGSTGLASTALSGFIHPGSLVASLAAGLTAPIFDGGRLRGQLELSKARQDELLAAYRKAILQALTDVDAALADMRATAEQERLQRIAVARSQRALDIARAQLQAGTVDLTAVLQAQTTLYAALVIMVEARQSHFLALVALFKALGGGWTDRDIRQPELIPGRVEGGVALPVGGNIR